MTIDYKIDGEVHEVVFKSSDGKLFSILKERALQSEVWKNMLQVGDNQTEEGGIDETKAVKLDEKSDEVLVFLETLDQSKCFTCQHHLSPFNSKWQTSIRLLMLLYTSHA